MTSDPDTTQPLDPAQEPAPGADNDDTRVDPGADPVHGTGSIPEHVDDTLDLTGTEPS